VGCAEGVSPLPHGVLCPSFVLRYAQAKLGQRTHKCAITSLCSIIGLAFGFIVAWLLLRVAKVFALARIVDDWLLRRIG
jgi:hypothetical protein